MISKKNTAAKPKKFLIINPFGIGDVLFTTPVVKAIKQSYPDSFIGYWSNARVKQVVSAMPQISKVFPLSRGDLKKIFQFSFFKGVLEALNLAWQIKGGRFDVCFDFSLDYRYGLFTKLIGIKKRIGFNYKSRGKFLTHKIGLAGYSEKHVVEYYLELLKFLDIPVKDKNLELNVTEEARVKAKNLLSSFGIFRDDLVIGIVPGAGGSWGKDAPYKHWPALKFAQVADRLAKEKNAKILILGDDSESEIAEVIIHIMRNKPINLVGKTGLDILPAVIESCNLLITNDGGPMHMVVALGVKGISVFGPVNERVYGPFPASDRHVVLKWDIECRPCYENFRLAACDKDRECLMSVSVDAVFEASLKLLS